MQVLVQQTDIWGGSASVYGVFTEREKLEEHVQMLLDKKAIELNPDSPRELPLSNFTIEDMHLHIDYLSVQEIDFNEEI